MAGIRDIFKQLRPFQWGDASFPVTEMKITLAHDLAEHKYWGQDGAKVEATGRQPLQFEATIPFHNGIFPGKGEAWDPRPLYPNGYRTFLLRMSERATNTLQHPELGPIKCKAKSCTTVWSGATQGGVTVQASWVETIDDALEFDIPEITGVEAAGDLDNLLEDEGYARLKALVPQLPTFTPDFAATMRGITGKIDKVSLLQKRVAGKIDNVAHQMEQFTDSIESSRKAITWPLGQSTNRLASALVRLKEELVASGKTLILVTVTTPMTLARLCAGQKKAVDDILRLNPHLARTVVIPVGTVVKSFQ